MLKIPLWEAIILFVISRVMLSSQTKYCNENNIKHIRTSSNSYLLPKPDRLEFLIKNGFNEIDIDWEKVNDN